MAVGADTDTAVALPPVAAQPSDDEAGAPGGAGPGGDRPVWAVSTADEVRVAARSSRRRRWRRATFAVVCVLVSLAVTGEVLGRRLLSHEVETRLRASGITGDVRVSFGGGWRPIVIPALLGAGLDRLTVRIADGTVGGLAVRRADYDLRGIDGEVSVGDRTLWVRSIDTGDVRIEVDPTSLSAATGTSIRIRGGRLVAGPDGVVVRTVVRGDALELGGDAESVFGGPIVIPIVDSQLLPCRPRVHLTSRSMVLSCRGRKVPGVLVDPLGGDRSPTAPVGELAPPQSTVLGGTGGGTDAGPGTGAEPTTGPESTSTTTVAPESTPSTVVETVPPAPAPGP